MVKEVAIEVVETPNKAGVWEGLQQVINHPTVFTIWLSGRADAVTVAFAAVADLVDRHRTFMTIPLGYV